jgi:hypothetical protein
MFVELIEVVTLVSGVIAIIDRLYEGSVFLHRAYKKNPIV